MAYGGSKVPIRASRNYAKGDFDKLRSTLQKVNWEPELQGDVNQQWCHFEKLVNSAIDECVPMRIQLSTKKLEWTTTKLDKAIKRKKKAWLQLSKGQCNWAKYKKVRNEENKIRRKARADYESKVCEAGKENPKLFWKYCNRLKRSTASVPMLKRSDGSTTETFQEVAEVLAKQYESVFSAASHKGELELEPGWMSVDVDVVHDLLANLN